MKTPKEITIEVLKQIIKGIELIMEPYMNMTDDELKRVLCVNKHTHQSRLDDHKSRLAEARHALIWVESIDE